MSIESKQDRRSIFDETVEDLDRAKATLEVITETHEKAAAVYREAGRELNMARMRVEMLTDLIGRYKAEREDEGVKPNGYSR